MLYGKTNHNDVSRFIREIPENFLTLDLYRPDATRRSLEYDYGYKPTKVYSVSGFENNRLVFNTSEEEVVNEYQEELAKEVGDCLWFIALCSRQLGYTLEEVAQINIDKLRDRAQRNVIIGEGDNR